MLSLPLAMCAASASSRDIDSAYWSLLPAREETASPEEVDTLGVFFNEGGELPAQKLHWDGLLAVVPSLRTRPLDPVRPLQAEGSAACPL